MKKLIALLLVLTIAFALFGCTDKTDDGANNNDSNNGGGNNIGNTIGGMIRNDDFINAGLRPEVFQSR